MFGLLADSHPAILHSPQWSQIVYLTVHFFLAMCYAAVALVSLRVLYRHCVLSRGPKILVVLWVLSSGGLAALEATHAYDMILGSDWRWVLALHLFTVLVTIPSAFITVAHLVPYAVALIKATRVRLDVRVAARQLRMYAENEANINSPVVTDTGSVSDDVVGEMARTKIAIHRIKQRQEGETTSAD